MLIRQARDDDVAEMSKTLDELVVAGKRTSSSGDQFVRSHYLNHPDRIHCAVAIDDRGVLLGFQSLKIATGENPYGTPTGWGIIGTHVRPSAARLGIGSRLFESTLIAARDARLPSIEAYIGRQNDAALAFYERMGFRTYREVEDNICKALRVADI